MGRRFSCVAKFLGDIRLKSIGYWSNKQGLRNSMDIILRIFRKINAMKNHAL